MSVGRWLVFEPPISSDADAPMKAQSDKARFVRDSFTTFGFLLTVIWLFWNRLWVTASVTLVLLVGLTFLARDANFTFFASVIELCLAILIGLEGRGLVAARLRRSGWRETAVIYASSQDEAETRYYYNDTNEPHMADNQRPTDRPQAMVPTFRMPWNREPRGTAVSPPLPNTSA